MEYPSILPILKKIPLLSDLNEKDHAAIIEHITLNYYPAGQELFKEGDKADRMYIIKTGQVKIYHPSDPENPVAMLGPDDFFGEMALFQDDPRNASAMMNTEGEVFLLERSDFYQLVLSNPDMSKKVSEEFLKRARENQKSFQEDQK